MGIINVRLSMKDQIRIFIDQSNLGKKNRQKEWTEDRRNRDRQIEWTGEQETGDRRDAVTSFLSPYCVAAQ